MDTMGFASSAVLAMVGIMSVFTFATYVVKKYADRNRLEVKTEDAALGFLVQDDTARKQISIRHQMLLSRFEEYANWWIGVIYHTASVTSAVFGLSMLFGAAVGSFFNRSMWSYENRIIAILTSIIMLGYAIYNYLKYRQLKKLAK